jgi:monoamine oxidase
MPEGMMLDKVVENDAVPLPTDSETVALKIISGADRLDSRIDKAVKDFDDAMFVLHKMFKEDGHIYYANAEDKAKVVEAFEAFFPKYEAVKAERFAFSWTKEEWKAHLKMN